MRMPICRQPDRLPKRFPVGAVYVIEGRNGKYGRLRVSSRYVKLPDGRRIEVQARQDGAAPPVRRQWQGHAAGRKSPGNVAKKYPAAAKNFPVGVGTPRQQSR